MQRAARKRALARAAAKQAKRVGTAKPKTSKGREKIAAPELLAEIRDALQTMAALLGEHGGDAIAGEFEVIERDAEGRVKRFRCLEK